MLDKDTKKSHIFLFALYSSEALKSIGHLENKINSSENGKITVKNYLFAVFSEMKANKCSCMTDEISKFIKIGNSIIFRL